jgi:quercetin dioxygenase-like cupin family protein
VAVGLFSASAQEAPPAIRFNTVASMNYTDQTRQYDVMQTLLELAPGAAVPSHKINGEAIITVLSGEVTKVEEGGEEFVFKAGQTYPESDEDHFDVDINKSNAPARLLVTFLLSPGAEPLVFNPNQPASAPGPTFVAVARTTVGNIPGNFTLTHGVFDVPPGWVGPLHTHDGWSIVTHLNGNVRNVVDGVVQPASFTHGPNSRHEGANTSGQTVSAMFASVGPTGAPPSRPLTTGPAPASPAPQAIRPPATGDGGLAH